MSARARPKRCMAVHDIATPEGARGFLAEWVKGTKSHRVVAEAVSTLLLASEARPADPPRCDECASLGIESLSHCSECGDPL